MVDQTLGVLDFLLLGARAFGLFAAFAAFAWALMRMRGEHAEQLELMLTSQRELTAQNQALSERVAALATLVATLPRRAEPLVEASPPPPRVGPPRRQTGVPSYETAKRMARSGASVEEIATTCGMAGTEARLLRRLHGADARRENAA